MSYRYKKKPFLLSGLKDYVFTTYVMTNKEVYVDRSFFGLWRLKGDRPSMETQSISRTSFRTKCYFGLYGDITFSEGSVDPVIWRNVFRPEAMRREIEEIRGRQEKLARILTEENISDTIFYFYHIPKAVNKLLCEREPQLYNSLSYRNRVGVGDIIEKGAVIAKYGKTEITAPCDGAISFLGDEKPGVYEWPENTLSFDDLSSIDDHRGRFCFGIRPTKEFFKEGRPELLTRLAFDQGSVFRDKKKKKGTDTFHTILDETALYLNPDKSGGVKPPKAILNDAELCKQLIDYWRLSNRLQAVGWNEYYDYRVGRVTSYSPVTLD